MPLPEFRRPPASASPASGQLPRRNIFVSYSHQDLDPDARDFVRHVRLALDSGGMGDRHVYLERGHLKAGDEWEPSLQEALDGSMALVFLMSSNSLSSRFCMEKEVAYAARHGLILIPVWLRSCAWKGLPVPGDPKGRTLGSFDAVPRLPHGASETAPLDSGAWTSRDAFLAAAAEQILGSLQRSDPVAAAASNIGHASGGSRLPRTAAYRCNQEGIHRSLRHAFSQWSPSGPATAVWLEGTDDDEPSRLWEAIASSTVAEALRAHGVAVESVRRNSPESPWKTYRTDPEDPWWAYLNASLSVMGNASAYVEGKAHNILGHLLSRRTFHPVVIHVAESKPGKPNMDRVHDLLDLIEAFPSTEGLGYLGLVFCHQVRDGAKGHRLGRYEAKRKPQKLRIPELPAAEALDQPALEQWLETFGTQPGLRPPPKADFLQHFQPHIKAGLRFRRFVEILTDPSRFALLDPT